MTVTINGKDYNLAMNTKIGAYYWYEVTFGTTFLNDAQSIGGTAFSLRLAYSVLTADNKDFRLTFDEFLEQLDEDTFVKMDEFLGSRLLYFAQQVQEATQNPATNEDSEEDLPKNV